MTTGEPTVVGRAAELQALNQFLADAPGCVGAMLLEGDAGIGKTALWRHGVWRAEQIPFRVLSATGSQAETTLAFAGLYDLLRDCAEEVFDELPAPQRRALRIALLLEDPDPEQPGTDHRAVAFAFLGVLRHLSARAPVLIAIDDVQWMDESSAAVLSFASRRLTTEAVRLLLTSRREGGAAVARSGGDFGPGTQRLRVGPLSLGAVQRLLAAHFGDALSRPTLRRIWESAGGNPFYALQIASALHNRDAPLRPGEPVPVPGDLHELLERRLDALSLSTQSVLRIVAAASEPTVPLLQRVGLDGVPVALAPAVKHGLVDVSGDRIRFTHPLLASAVYQAMDPSQRRSVHRTLATAMSDGEERARHMALASEHEDESVAAVLEEQANIVRVRGGSAAAADLSEQAWRLTPAPDRDAAQRRCILAARFHFESGDSPRAVRLLEDAASEAVAGESLARVLSRLARIQMYQGDQRKATELFEEALGQADQTSRARADAEEGLATALYLMRERLPAAAEHAAHAVELVSKHDDVLELAAALGTRGLIEGVLGRPEAMETLREALALEDAPASGLWHGDARVMRRPVFDVGAVSLWQDDFAEARRRLEAARDVAVEQGDDSSLVWLLGYLSGIEYLSGDWAAAASHAHEAVEAGSQIGQRPAHAVALSFSAMVHASLGQERAAWTDTHAALGLAGDQPAMLARINCAWAIGILELSQGRPEAAHDALAPVVEHVREAGVGEPGSIRFVPDDVEALVELDRIDDAVEVLDWFEQRAVELQRDSALATSARCRALLAATAGRLDDAEAAVEQALELHRRSPVVFDRARTLLVGGAILRRAGRKRAAREALDEAMTVFDALGARLWVTRADAEIRRIGGRKQSSGELTAAELRVGRLIAKGMSNREVAAALFVSPRTVEYHLSRIYTKLGLRSRVELATRLQDDDSTS